MFTVYKSANGLKIPNLRAPLVVSCIFLVGLPSGPLSGTGSGVLPHPTQLPQKGCPPHPTGTARVITLGKRNVTLSQSRCGQARLTEGRGPSWWAAPDLHPGICWGHSSKKARQASIISTKRAKSLGPSEYSLQASGQLMRRNSRQDM